MLITCWYMVGLPFTGSVVCHTLPLFGKSTLGIISIDFLYDSFTRVLPLLSFSVALPLLSFTVLSVFMLITSTISPSHHCSRQYADAVLTLLRSFIKRSGSAHVYYTPGGGKIVPRNIICYTPGRGKIVPRNVIN